MTDYTVTADRRLLSDRINPGEEMEKVMEAMAQRGTWIGLSTLSNSDTDFSVTMEKVLHGLMQQQYKWHYA